MPPTCPFLLSITAPMPSQYANRWFGPLPKGVANRNGAMKWLRCHATKGVMYMADDDNTYDMRIFHEVCLLTGFLLHFNKSKPIWCCLILSWYSVNLCIFYHTKLFWYITGIMCMELRLQLIFLYFFFLSSSIVFTISSLSAVFMCYK